MRARMFSVWAWCFMKCRERVGPLNVKLLRLALIGSSETLRLVVLQPFENAYWQTFTLSPNANQLAYVARQDNAANIWVISLINGHRHRLTANVDPVVNLRSLTWTPQADAIGFTKQSSTTSIGDCDPDDHCPGTSRCSPYDEDHVELTEQYLDKLKQYNQAAAGSIG